MATTRTEHRAKIAEARNVLGEVISRARYADEPTILINRGKEAAVIVGPDFYERAKRDRALVEILERRAQRKTDDGPLVNHARVLRAELDLAQQDVNAALNIAES